VAESCQLMVINGLYYKWLFYWLLMVFNGLYMIVLGENTCFFEGK
jgi:hypothetical protein